MSNLEKTLIAIGAATVAVAGGIFAAHLIIEKRRTDKLLQKEKSIFADID